MLLHVIRMTRRPRRKPFKSHSLQTRSSGLQHLNKRFLWNIDGAERLHPLLAFFLLFEQLPFAADVAAITFGGDVLAHCADSFARDDFAADGGLDGDGVLLF